LNDPFSKIVVLFYFIYLKVFLIKIKIMIIE
jgi:hypothetical protein